MVVDTDQAGILGIDPVQGQHGTSRRKRRGPIHIIVPVQFVFQTLRGLAAPPRVHVAHQHRRAGIELGMVQKHLDLPSARPVHQGKVRGHHAEAAALPLKLSGQGPSTLQSRGRYIQHRNTGEGKTGKNGVPELTPPMNPCHSEGQIEAKLVTNGLKRMRFSKRHKDFLKRKYIGANFLDHSLGATRIGPGSTTVPREAMHVVAGHFHALARRMLRQWLKRRTNQRQVRDRKRPRRDGASSGLAQLPSAADGFRCSGARPLRNVTSPLGQFTASAIRPKLPWCRVLGLIRFFLRQEKFLVAIPLGVFNTVSLGPTTPNPQDVSHPKSSPGPRPSAFSCGIESPPRDKKLPTAEWLSGLPHLIGRFHEQLEGTHSLSEWLIVPERTTLLAARTTRPYPGEPMEEPHADP